MLRKIKLMTLLLGFSAFSASAEDSVQSLYYGLEIGNGKYDASNTVEDTMLDVGGAVGLRILPFLSVEARLGVGSNDDSSLVGDSEVVRGAGLLKLDYVGNNVIAYIAGGVGAVNSDRAGVKFDDDGVVVGVGVELFGNERTALSISYTNYERDKAKLDYTVANIGFRHYFGAQF